MELKYIAKIEIKSISPKNYFINFALIVLLLFGGRKIPELMKGLGKGVKSFKDGMNGVENDLNPDNNDKK